MKHIILSAFIFLTVVSAAIAQNITALSAKISEANTLYTEIGNNTCADPFNCAEGTYRMAAYTSLQSAITAANAKLNSSSQNEIDAAVTALNDAILYSKSLKVEAPTTPVTSVNAESLKLANSNTQLNISSTNVIEEVEIYNVFGKLMAQKTINTKETSINTAWFPKGIYLAKIIYSKNTIETYKFVKK